MVIGEKKAVLVLGPVFGIFSTVAEVLDSPEDGNKIFRFREGCKWHAEANGVKSISVWSHWPEKDTGTEEPGVKEGSYRICKKLDTLPGYVAVLEGTTKSEPKTEDTRPVVSSEALRCEDAIMQALESEPRMPLRALKRKTHAHRFGAQWDDCLQDLADAGEIRLEEAGARTWVTLAPDVDALAPVSDAAVGATKPTDNDGDR